MSSLPIILVAPPPKDTPFIDATGRITLPWLAWLGTLTSIGVTVAGLSTSIAGALLAALNLSDLTNAAAARSNLGLGTAATHAAGDFDASGAAAAVLATSLQKLSNLSDLANVVTSRLNLGLGSAATTAASDYDVAGAAAAALAAAIAASDPVGAAAAVLASSLQKAANLSDLVSASTARSNLGLGTAATTAASAYDVAGAATAAQAAAILASLQRASNLSDVANALTSRTNLAVPGLHDANVFDALNTYQAGAIYKTPIGTAQLIIDGTTLLQQVVMQIFDNGVSKWLFGKQADNSFFIFDQVQGRNLMMTDPVTGALTLNTFTTVLGQFLVAASGSQTDINGKTIRFYNCNASAAALVAGDNTGNTNALEITKAAAVVSCKFPNGPVTFTVAPVFTDQSGTRTALALGTAATTASTAYDAAGAATTAQAAAIAVSCQRASNLSDVASAATARTNLAVPGLATQNTFMASTTAASGAQQIVSGDPSLRLKATGAVVADQNTFEIRNIGAPGFTYLQFRTVNDAFSVFSDKMQLWQSGGLHLGTTAVDPGANNLSIAGIFIGIALRIPAGANTKTGTGTLVAGAATIANTSVTAASRIFLQCTQAGALTNVGVLIVASQTAATGFTIKSTNAADTSTFCYWVVES